MDCEREGSGYFVAYYTGNMLDAAAMILGSHGNDARPRANAKLANHVGPALRGSHGKSPDWLGRVAAGKTAPCELHPCMWGAHVTTALDIHSPPGWVKPFPWERQRQLVREGLGLDYTPLNLVTPHAAPWKWSDFPATAVAFWNPKGKCWGPRSDVVSPMQERKRKRLYRCRAFLE